MKSELLERLLDARRQGVAVALATLLTDGAQLLFHDDAPHGDLTLTEADLALVRKAIAADRNSVLDTSAGPVFLEIWNPPLRLAIVGAVHVAQALAPIAAIAGYQITVIDPRTPFTAAHRFPDVSVVNDWPDEAIARFNPDKRSAVVTLTHDPKLDDPALLAALRSASFYIGALGSPRTHARRCERLRDAGVGGDGLARIKGPVGLDIRARTPAEIAVSIVAEMTAVLRAG